MSAVSIRPATPADIPIITRIYAHSVRTGTASFELEPPTEAEMARRMQALHDGGYPYLVAEIDGAVKGYAYAGAYRTRPAYRFSVEDSIYIDPAAQRRGVGRALLAALIEECERRGFRQMIAVIGEPSNTASIRLHEKFGFRLVGTFQGIAWKQGRWLDTVQMQRELGAGNHEPPHDR